MPERNVELLEATLQQILDHPDLHEQQYWASQKTCGTAFCFAGWAAHLQGWQAGHWRPSDRHLFVSNSFAKDGRWWDGATLDLGALLLGLTDDEAKILFNGNNTRPMLALMVKDLVNGDELRAQWDYYAEAGDALPAYAEVGDA